MNRHPRVTLCLVGIFLLIGGPHASLAEKPQVWRRLRSPNFVVVTNANEKQARRVAYRFELIRAVFRQVFGLQGASNDPPVIIIGAKDEATLMPLLPATYQAKGSMHPAGIYVGGPEKNYVALRLDVTMSEEAYEPFEAVYHEYVHYLMRRQISVLPLWMTEGLAEFYGNTRLEGKLVLVGAPSNSNLIVLHREQLLPLSTLFAANASSPYYHESNKASIFYAQSWALTHYLITRDWREKTNRVNDFVALLGANTSVEDAAKRTIGDPTALDEALRHYIGMFSFTVARFAAPTGIDEDAFTPAPISEAESLAVRGDFLVHAGRTTEARQMLEEALKFDPRLASAHESMGLLYAEQKNTEEANKWYSQAVALNSQSYLAHFYYATNLMKGKLDDEHAARAESSLRTAIEINPEFAPSYAALAFLLAGRHRDLEEARKMTLQAVTLERGNVQYRLQMANLLLQMDRAEDALRVANLAATMAKTLAEEADVQTALENIRRFQEYKQRLHEQEVVFKKTQAEMGGQNESLSSPSRPPGGGTSETSSSHNENSPAPLLRHRDETETTRSINPSAQSAEPASRERPELSARTETADGTITETHCSGRATLELSVASSAGTFQLYSDQYFTIPYSAQNFSPQGLLNPCSDMKNMHARITYHPAKNHPKAGQIVAVQLIK